MSDTSTPEQPTMSTILNLPIEMLSEIVEHLDDDDLPNFRLTSKILSRVGVDRFAKAFFRERVYKLSPSGIKALQQVSEHPALARRITSIVIAQRNCHELANYHNQINEAFRNLSLLGNNVSIGVRRTIGGLDDDDVEGISRNMLGFLQSRIIEAAVQTRLSVQGILVDVPAYEGLRPQRTNPALWPRHFPSARSREQSVSPNKAKILPSKNFTVRFIGAVAEPKPNTPDSEVKGYLAYTHDGGHLKGHNFTYFQVRYLDRYWENLRDIRLHKCDIERVWFWECVVTPHARTLKHLELDDVHIYKHLPPDTLGMIRATWRNFFYLLDPALELTSCRFNNLWVGKFDCWLAPGNCVEVTGVEEVKFAMQELAAGRMGAAS